MEDGSTDLSQVQPGCPGRPTVPRAPKLIVLREVSVTEGPRHGTAMGIPQESKAAFKRAQLEPREGVPKKNLDQGMNSLQGVAVCLRFHGSADAAGSPN